MKVGFIDYYLDEWHANNYPDMLKKQSQGKIEVCYAYGKIPSPKNGKTSEEWCQEYGIELCNTIEEVVEKSDVLIVLSPNDPEMHEELSELALKSGKRTYIDKTFAPTKKAAEAMFSLAEQYGTPCYSTSALRFAAEYEPFKDKNIESAAFWGPHSVEVYSIHQLEPMRMLMKANAKRVLAQARGRWTDMIFEWEDGRITSMLCTGGKKNSFMANLGVEADCETVKVESDFFGAFIENLIRFFETGETPVSHEETISIMALREAALKAKSYPGEWVEIE